jgi:hypothetical protein
MYQDFGHTAWSKDAWTSMVGQFNSRFSLAFTVAQVKQKEQDLKEFRVVKELQEESGFGWDSSRMMVTAPESVWRGVRGTSKQRHSSSMAR